MTQKTQKRNGRPPSEFSEGVLRLMDAYEGCGTVSDLCEYLQISSTVFYKWLKYEERFSEAVTRAKDFTDDAVENALLKRALGFEFTETSERKSDGGDDDKGEKYVYTETRKFVPGDVGAQKHWLAVRRGEKWNVAKKVEVSGDYQAMLKKYADDDQDAPSDDA